MRLQSVLMTVAGLALAGGSVWFANGQLAAGGTPVVVAPAPMATVWVAGRDIAYGQTLTADDLMAQPWPVAALPEGAVSDIALILGNPEGDAQPRRARQRIAKGEPVSEFKLAAFGETVSLVQTLGANTRAMAIKVDAVTAVGGFVSSGDRVDIVLTQGHDAGLRAATILQDIRVIGIDQSTDPTGERAAVARTITVEVTPAEGQKLALAQRAGTLSLTLRTLDGVQDTALDQITLEDLLSEAVVAPAPAAPVVQSRSVTVRRGNAAEIVTLN